MLPAITPPVIHPPLGVESKMLPSLSITEICVVSLRLGSTSFGSRGGCGDGSRPAIQNGHSFTWSSNGSGSPAIWVGSARFMSICAARAFAYSLDSRPFSGTFTNVGSA